MAFTNADLALKISNLIAYWAAFNEEYADWLGGTVSGGPGADGNYPLTDYEGNESLVACPAKLADNVSGYVGLASASETAAAASAAAALVSETAAALSETNASTYKDAAAASAVTATNEAADADSSATVSTAQANLATDRAGYAQEWAITIEDTLVSVAAGGNGTTDYSALHHAAKASADATSAAADAVAAAASAAAAATFDPVLYAALADNETITGGWTFDNQYLTIKTPDTYASPPVVKTQTLAGIRFVDQADVEIFRITEETNGGFSFKSSVRGQNFSFSGVDTNGVAQTCAIMSNTLNAGFSAYNNGDTRFSTSTSGVSVVGTLTGLPSAGATQTGNVRIYPKASGEVAGEWGYNGSTDLRIMNYVHGGDFYLMLQDVAGTWVYPFRVTAESEVQVIDLAATGTVTGSNLNVANWDTAYGWGDHAGLYSLAAHNHAGVYEPADATILKDADIGVTVQAYDATYVVDADIGVTVAAFSHSHSDYLSNTGVASHGGDIDFTNILGDRITLWGTHDAVTSYALGIESGTMYFKADAQYRWYFDVNADDGVSDTMELTPNALYVNTQVLGGNGYGSAGTPSFTSTQDANSGMYVSASDTLGFSTGGVERVKINSSGLTMTGAGSDVILGNNSLTADNISGSVGAAPLKIGNGTGSPMVWGQYCSLGRTYSAARTGLANNAYVDSDDSVSGQWRHLVTHGSYGHTILELAGGGFYFYGNGNSVTSGNIVSKNHIMQLDFNNGLKVTSTANGNPGTSWSSLSKDMLHLDGKEVIDGNDTWLRINQNGDFSNGCYLPNPWSFANVMKRYNKGAYLFHQSSSYNASGAGGITFSTSAASGGVSGDIWFQYT